MKTITVSFGSRSITDEIAHDMTFGQLIRSPKHQAILGNGDNVQALVYDTVQPEGNVIPDGAEIVLETKACTKG